MEGYKKDLLNFVKFKVKGESNFHSLDSIRLKLQPIVKQLAFFC